MLVVNCYVDDTRQAVARTHKIPQAMAPVYLAGTLDATRCEIRLWSELYSGPLCDPAWFAWPDLLVLTGLVTALDRMRHLAAYVRSANPAVRVVAGGHAVRAFPRFAARFFDHCCLGDVEELGVVADDLFGRGHAAEDPAPRFDLAPWIGRVGYLESSRNCNFRCDFCTLTAEGRRYQAVAFADLRRQITVLGRRRHTIFVDNNFLGADRRHFAAKLAVLAEERAAGRLGPWSALVTGDFFADDRLLDHAGAAGCEALFTGIESLDGSWLAAMHKGQNTRRDPLAAVRRALEAGVVVAYGMVFDLSTRTVAAARAEIEALLETRDVTLPAYLSAAVPLPGTPFFHRCHDLGLLLPSTRVRDLDSATLSLRSVDALPVAAAFVRELQSLPAYRSRVLHHAVAFARRYRATLNRRQLAIALTNAALLCLPDLASAPGRLTRRRPARTHISSTDWLDDLYHPQAPIAARYAHYFAPAMLTDAAGGLHDDVAEDLAIGARSATARPTRAAVAAELPPS